MISHKAHEGHGAMKNMLKSFCYAAVACLFLAQCASTSRVMPEYKNMNVGKSRLGIILLKESMVIDNPDDIASGVGSGETKEVFYGFFTSRFKESAGQDGKFNDVVVINGCDTSGFARSTQYLSFDDPVQVRIPSNKTCAGDSAPFLLILDFIAISRDQKSGTKVVTMGYSGSMGMTTVGAYDNLVLKGTFVLWDTFAKKIVSFGKISEKTDVSMGLTKQTWITAVESISSRIFVDTPYGISSVPKEKQKANQ